VADLPWRRHSTTGLAQPSSSGFCPCSARPRWRSSMTRRAYGFGCTRPWSNSGWFQPIDGLQEPDGAKISLWYSFSSLTPLSWKTGPWSRAESWIALSRSTLPSAAAASLPSKSHGQRQPRCWQQSARGSAKVLPLIELSLLEPVRGYGTEGRSAFTCSEGTIIHCGWLKSSSQVDI
jgi:hypothetical protein